MNEIKCVCICPYGLKEKNGTYLYDIGDVVSIVINNNGNITHLIDKTSKKWIFLSSEETFYECFKPLAEMRNEKINQILDDN